MRGRRSVTRQAPGGIRILFIPDAPPRSTSERTPELLRIFRQRYRVVALKAPWDRIIYDPKRGRFPRLAAYCLDKALLAVQGLFRARRVRANVIFCESVHHAIAGLVIARILNVRCVWDSHGSGKLLYTSLGKPRTSIRFITALERYVAKRVDSLVTVSDTDAAAYSDLGVPRSKIHVIPVCVNLADIDSAMGATPLAPRSSDVPVLVFFGSFGYAPNRGALDFINTYLAPSLEQRGIRCEIWVAGSDFPPGEYHPFVRPLGFVRNIHSIVRSADLSIVPVRQGVGVLTKVIDSMAAGTPLVMFEFAASGISGLRHGIHAYVASTDSEFVRHVLEALADPDSARRLSRRARQLAEQGYDWRAHLARLDEILAGIPAQGRG